MAKKKPATSSAPTSKPLDIAVIRAAVTRNRGGWNNASDADLRALWNGLPAELQAAYLQPSPAAPQEKTPDAPGTEPATNA